MYANTSDSSDRQALGPSVPERRFAALRGCDRLLSGVRPQSLRERLAELTADAEAGYDLDRRPDMYGDGVVLAVERRTAELLGTEDAAYFPTGTMAQQAALQVWAERAGNRTVAMHPLSHLELHERRAYSTLSGLRGVWPTTARRLPTPAEIRGSDERFATVMLELPLRDAGFLLPSWAELTETVAAVRERGAQLHVDGARLWESAAHLGRTLPEIVALADSVYVSYYKSLRGLSGAALVGDREFVRAAKAWRHRYGGQLFQQWPAALSALAGLERELPRLGSYVSHAKLVAQALSEQLATVPGARVIPEPPHTHQFQLWLPYPARALNEAGIQLAEEHGLGLFGGWDDGVLPGLSMTEVTIASAALEWTAKDVRTAVEAFLALL
ncbi:threonine aldolase family protein [Kitasatospora sp. NPDC050543]|uniref:threonine aldolase family protein n=1 Tax=Kitasatospora sp. NPDC050543 TaxID=3364054 RepID=UPI00379076FD